MAQGYVYNNGEWDGSATFKLGNGQDPDGRYVMVNGEWVEFGKKWIDDFERANLNPYYERSTTGNETISTNSYSGEYAYYGDGLTELWSMTGDGLQNYPAPGNIHRVNINMESFTTETQYWLLFGGDSYDSSDRYPRYQVEFIQDGTFRVQMRVDGDRWTVAVDDYSSVNFLENNWYTVIFMWYDSSQDGRTGVRAQLYDADDFESDEFSASAIEDIDSADYPNDDGSDVIDSIGRYGMRTSSYGSAYIDGAEILNEDPF